MSYEPLGKYVYSHDKLQVISDKSSEEKNHKSNKGKKNIRTIALTNK